MMAVTRFLLCVPTARPQIPRFGGETRRVSPYVSFSSYHDDVLLIILEGNACGLFYVCTIALLQSPLFADVCCRNCMGLFDHYL